MLTRDTKSVGDDSMQGWLSEVLSFILGAVGGLTIGSLVTFKFIKKSTVDSSRSVVQSNIKAGRDNVGGDKINNG